MTRSVSLCRSACRAWMLSRLWTTRSSVILRSSSSSAPLCHEVSLSSACPCFPRAHARLLGVIRHTLGVVDLQAVAQTPTELTLKTHRTLDPHVVPCGLVIDSADGRRLACVLESEGRRLEVIDLAALT